jgi:hypothetical protein
MMQQKKTGPLLLLITVLTFACTRNDISFGTTPENEYTRLSYIDSVEVKLATVFADSFVTSGQTNFLLGQYRDPYLGTINGKSTFQLTVPSSTTTIAATAVFDSLTLIVRLNKYYYGDTTQPMTIQVKELSTPITYSYNNKLYNTSNIDPKINPLGEKSGRIYPGIFDSIIIRLNDAKGLELFNKLRSQATEVTNQTDFLNYFYGLTLTTDNTNSFMLGFKAAASQVVMRVHYHNTNPYHEKQFIDFPSLSNDYAFNRLVADRTGTGLTSSGGNINITEIPAAQTNHHAFTQESMSTYTKITFPSLRNILVAKSNYTVKLIKAELVLRPTPLSYNNSMYKLPDSLFLSVTDATNLAGSTVADSTGQKTLYAPVVIDNLYGEGTYYRFNITAYISTLLINLGTEKHGFFIRQAASVTPNVTRLVLSERGKEAYSSQLLLTVMYINK